MASFKQIMALCLGGASYAQISSALGCVTECLSDAGFGTGVPETRCKVSAPRAR